MRKLTLAVVLVSSLSAFGQLPSVKTEIRRPAGVDAEQRATWVVVLENLSDAPLPAQSIHVTNDARPGQSAWVSVPAGCRIWAGRYTECSIALAPREKRELTFVVSYSQPYGWAELSVGTTLATIYSDTIFAREFPVTNTSDAGPGSLRQAILDINNECTGFNEYCGPAFRIDGPVPAEGWFTIRLLSPLPPIAGSHTVLDGSSQSHHTGETNPHGGPEIMLDGSAAGFAHGLDGHSTREFRVTDLAIGGFAGNGIQSSTYTTLKRNYVGVDPTGVVAAPNGWRGVQTMRSSIVMQENVLSGNLRSGAWLTNDYVAVVERNLIGVGADGVTPLGNGASGLYFERSSDVRQRSRVHDNVIAYNAHAGISLSPTAGGTFGENTFRSNAGRAIDINIDGPTLQPTPGIPSRGGIVGAPRIVSADYEGGVTTIVIDAPPQTEPTLAIEAVYVYANALPKDGGELLGKIDRQHGSHPGPPFVFRFAGDLRGQYVSASVFAVFIEYEKGTMLSSTSEVSDPRLVR